MRFNSKAYDELFTREKPVETLIDPDDSMVEKVDEEEPEEKKNPKPEEVEDNGDSGSDESDTE